MIEKQNYSHYFVRSVSNNQQTKRSYCLDFLRVISYITKA